MLPADIKDADSDFLLKRLAQEFYIGPVEAELDYKLFRQKQERLCRKFLEAATTCGDERMTILAMFLLYRNNFEYSESMKGKILEKIKCLDMCTLSVKVLVELALVLVMLEEEESAFKHIGFVKSVLGFKHCLKGYLGLKSKHQAKKVAILRVCVEEGMARNEIHHHHHLPHDLQLNDDDLLDAPKVDDDYDPVPINQVCCALLLIDALYIEKFETFDDQAVEKIDALVDKVLECSQSWSIRRMALYVRSLTESKKSKFSCRSMSQLESLLSEAWSCEPELEDRFEHFTLVCLPDLHTLSTEVASSFIRCEEYLKAAKMLQSLGSLNQAAICLISAGKLDEALPLLTAELETNPHNHVAAHLIGTLKNDNSYFLKAWEASKFTYCPALQAYALSLYKQDKLEEAKDCFVKLVEIGPTVADNWFRLGCCLLKLQSWDQSLDAFRRVIALDHDHLQAWNNLAIIHLHFGNLGHAQHAVKMSIRLEFDSWRLWENLFRISLQLGDLSECVLSYQRLLELRGVEAGLFPFLKLVEAISNASSIKSQIPAIQSLMASMETLLGTLDAMFAEQKDYLWLKNEFIHTSSLGRHILGRNYRDHFDLDCQAQIFFSHGIDEGTPPVFEEDSTHFLFITHNSIYIVVTTKSNVDAIEVFAFLQKLVNLIEHYIVQLTEESLRDNYVLVYELLDEMVDYGIVLMTDPSIVRDFVTQKGLALFQKSRPDSLTLSNVLSWRPEGISHKKNEVYLDVIEKVNMLANSNGEMISCSVLGEILVKCYLSGMPELKLGLNDRAMLESHGKGLASSSPPVELGIGLIEIEDVKFHQCVQLPKFDQEKIISFIPPDGEFVLMSYRAVGSELKPLFWLECVVERQTEASIELFVLVRSQFKKRSAANNVEIVIPVPEDADSPRIKSNIGSYKYKPELNAIVWKIGYFPGGKEFSLSIKVGRPIMQREDLESVKRSSAENVFGIKKPISLSFELPYFTISGIQVRYLKIMEKSGYNALPWVRYITKNGLYQIRMPDRSY